ncbi:MAG: response regulator [Caulobacter sp.]|nr:response regulator [Caulobacter sp.]
MSSVFSSVFPHLPASAAERVKQIPIRILLALVLAWSLHAAGDAAWIVPWLAVSASVQLFEFAAMARFRRADAAGAGTASRGLALAAIVLMSSIHALMGVVLWMTGMPVLITVSLLMICGGLLTNVASSPDNRPLFLLGATPYLVVLPVLPVEAVLRGHAEHLPLLILAIALFFGAILAVWNQINTARRAEITALAQAERRLEEAEAAMADRAAMAAIVSHELRTPVSAILAGAQVMRGDQASERVTHAADLIVDASRLMAAMLNDLLDHSKIEARAMSLETRDFELRTLVEETVRFWEPQARTKGLTIECAPPETMWIKGDPFRIRQILNNLISNAIKFTEHGAVLLEATGAVDAEARRIRFRVRDQGPGITADAMQRLFAPFAQGSAEVARTYGGTGLGLTVSRDLARLMGGELTADSAVGQGATFTFEVALPAGEPCDEASHGDAPEPRLQRRLRVLAVDDHEINRRTLALVLQPLDVEFATASNGQDALDVLAERPFDVVLMDVNMPGIDGNEATRRLRASDGQNAGVPVIGFSAGAEPAQIAACHAAGMTDWLPKPLEPHRLYEALERAIARREAA